MFKVMWKKLNIFSRSPKAHRMQRGQALMEYWPLIGGATGLLFAGLGVVLSPWLNEVYQIVVDAMFGVQSEPTMVCVPEEEASFPTMTTSETHRFELVTWVYNDANDTTTVGYTVSSQALGNGPAISHWVLELSNCLTPSSVVSASESFEFVDPDPRTGARGVKFDRGFNDNETRTFFVTFNGNLEKLAGNVWTKAANNIDSGTIQAPGCEDTSECVE